MSAIVEAIKDQNVCQEGHDFNWTGPWAYCGSYPGYTIPVYGICVKCGEKVEKSEIDLKNAFNSEQIAFVVKWKMNNREDAVYYPKRNHMNGPIM